MDPKPHFQSTIDQKSVIDEEFPTFKEKNLLSSAKSIISRHQQIHSSVLSVELKFNSNEFVLGFMQLLL